MWRILLAGLVFSFSLSALADEPLELAKKPQHERLLKGDDAKRAEELEVQFKSASAIARMLGTYPSPQVVKTAQEMLELRERVQGADHWEVRDADLALKDLKRPLTAEQRGRLKEAVRNNQRGLAIGEKAQYLEAVAAIEAALRTCREIEGEKHPHTATCLNNLAELYYQQADYAKAEPLYQDALRIKREVLGDKHPKTATSLNNLASLYQSQSAYAKAESLFQDALKIWRDVYGDNHPNTATSLSNLAELYRLQGAYAKAQPLLQAALRIEREVLGEKHASTAASLGNLAALYDSLGEDEKAESLYQEALRIDREVHGKEHRDTARSLNNLGELYRKQGAYSKAEPLLRDALRVVRETQGDKHPNTAICLNNLAALYQSQNAYSKAEPLYEDALRIDREVLGEKHPRTANGLINLATLYDSRGEYEKAESLYQDALKICREALGENNPLTATNLSNLAALHTEQGAYARAEPFLFDASRAYEASRLIAAKGFERAIATSGHSPYPLRAATLAALARPRDACQALELDLARALLDVQSSQGGAELTPDEKTSQASLSERLGVLQRRILKLATEKERSEAEGRELAALIGERKDLDGQLSALAVAISRREVAGLAEIQMALPKDAALIAWVDVANSEGQVREHWGCVVRPTGEPHWERLPGIGEKDAWTNADSDLPGNLRSALTGRGIAQTEVEKLAAQLHAQRIAPLVKHLVDVQRLYVAPVNKMAGIPVETLTRDLTISYIPSGTLLVRAKEKTPAAGNEMLAVGDPVFARRDSAAEGRNATEGVPYSELPPNGLLITQVAPGGAAAKGRLQVGDVIVKYGETEITSMKALDEAMEKAASAKEVTVLVWRETEKEPFTRTVAPGKLGVALAKEPAREALANRRKTDAMLAALRGSGWKELPGTRVELTQIGRLFGDKTTTLVDSAASEESLEALRKKGDLTRFRYIHFATHGEGNQVKAFESALILSQDGLPPDPLPKPGEPFINGQLSAREVLDFWKLDAELVTLSACETAIGKAGGGDGLLGFAQAFLTAGARSVCLSLWKVDDTATALLMQRFYQNLLGKRPGLDKPMGKAAALDEAKRWLRELSSDDALMLSADMSNGVVRGTRGKGEDLKLVVPSADPKEPAAKDAKPFAHPRYWAAFILIGDPN